MRARLSLVLCLALGLAAVQTSPLAAGPTSADRFGMGIEVGGGLNGTVGNLSLTGKYWFNGIHALDMDLGGGYGGITLGADYLWHNYRVFHRRDLALYYGVGGYLNAGNNTKNFGAGGRGKIGTAWLIPRTPWEVYAETVPSLNLIGGLGFGVGIAAGGRYYF